MLQGKLSFKFKFLPPPPAVYRLKNHLKSRYTSGRSMIEMLGVLAIIGILSAGGIWGYNLAMENYRINQTIKDIETMAANVNNIFLKYPPKQQNIFGKQLNSIGILPDKYYKTARESCINRTACNMKSLLNQRMEIYIAMISRQGTGSLFYLKDGSANRMSGNIIWLSVWNYGITKSQCVKLATHNWQNFGNHTFIEFGSDVEVFYELPLSLSEAETKCSSLSSDPTDSKSRVSMFIFMNGRLIKEE